MSQLLSGQLLFAALTTGALYGLIALGLNFVYGTLRLLNVAHGDVVMIGAYIAYGAMTLIGLPPPLSMILAALVCAALGLALYEVLFRRLLLKPEIARRLESNSLLIFFGLSIILQNLMALAFSASPRGYQYWTEVYRFEAVAFAGNRLFAFAVAFVLCAGTYLTLRFSTLGLAVRALIERPEAALVVGVNLPRLRRISFGAGFALAGIAGVLISQTEQINPFMGFPFTISAFVVIILGGLGNIPAGLAAGFLLGALETYGVALTSASLRSVLVYGAFILILMVRPQGLFGRAVR